jgi:hypothetical protein
MSQSLILIDALLVLVGRKKERTKKDKRPGGFFFPGADIPGWLCCVGFSWLLGAIKG